MSKTAATALSLTFLFALPVNFAHAALIEATSRVAEATIYSDRALVTRAAKVHLPAGEHTISITDLPAGLNESTLRVQGKAAAAVKIGTVGLKHVFLTELANTAERDKNAQIEAKTNEKTLIQAEIKALQAKESFITRVIDSGAEKHDANGTAKLDFAPEKWQQAWTLVQTGMTETGKELANKNIAITKIDADISKLQQELAQMRSGQAKQRRDARINVESAAETDIELNLTYQTSGANWRPVYDARLDTASGQLQLEQYGSVMQYTGEDWTNADLTLSTAQPAQGSEMPRLAEWWVRILQPMRAQVGYMMDAMEASGGVMRSKMAQTLNSAPMAPPMPSAVMEERMEAEQVTASAATTEYSAEFKVPGRVDLKSTRDTTKLYLGNVKMKADLFAQTTPRLGAQAYLFAKAKNGETYPLIPGEVAKYRDGAFIGNAVLPLVRPDEESKFSFGVDDRVKVEYKRIKDKQDNPALVLVGDMKVERQYQTKVQNLHKTPVSIAVFDQYPVAADADVKVTLIDDQTTPKYAEAEDKRQGVIVWEGAYNPKEEKTFLLGFRVSFPKGKTVQGL